MVVRMPTRRDYFVVTPRSAILTHLLVIVIVELRVANNIWQGASEAEAIHEGQPVLTLAARMGPRLTLEASAYQTRTAGPWIMGLRLFLVTMWIQRANDAFTYHTQPKSIMSWPGTPPKKKNISGLENKMTNHPVLLEQQGDRLQIYRGHLVMLWFFERTRGLQRQRGPR
jgi:hypothetical protein